MVWVQDADSFSRDTYSSSGLLVLTASKSHQMGDAQKAVQPLTSPYSRLVDLSVCSIPLCIRQTQNPQPPSWLDLLNTLLTPPHVIHCTTCSGWNPGVIRGASFSLSTQCDPQGNLLAVFSKHPALNHVWPPSLPLPWGESTAFLPGYWSLS